MSEILLPDEASPLDDLIDRALVHERIGAVVSPFLLRAALVADVGLLGMILLGSVLHGEGIKDSSFFLVGGGLVGGLVEFLQSFAWPLLGVAMFGLALNLWCRGRRTPAWVHTLCAAQAIPALGLSLGWILVAVAFVLALIIWIAIIAIGIALAAAIIAALASGS